MDESITEHLLAETDSVTQEINSDFMRKHELVGHVGGAGKFTC